MNVPYLKQKIWYAFEGLPIKNVNGVNRLSWPKCLVLTNNLMYILQFSLLTEEFKKSIPKMKAELHKGISYQEYMDFLEKYMYHHVASWRKNKLTENEVNPDSDESGRRPSLSNSIESGLNSSGDLPTGSRPRGNTMDYKTSTGVGTIIPTSGVPQLSRSVPKEQVELSSCVNTLDDYCWTLYRTTQLPRLAALGPLHRTLIRLWNIFIEYGIRTPTSKQGNHDDDVEVPVHMDALEAEYLLTKVQEQLGVGSRARGCPLELEEAVTRVDLEGFYSLLLDDKADKNSGWRVGISDGALEVALAEVCEQALDGVVLKAALKVDRTVRFCVLRAGQFLVYGSKVTSTNLRATVAIETDTEITFISNRIQIKSPGQLPNPITVLEISDTQQLNQWRTGLMDSLDMARKGERNLWQYEATLRRQRREQKRLFLRSNREEMEARLEQERQARLKETEFMEEKLSKAGETLKAFELKMMEEQKEKENLRQQTEQICQEKESRINAILAEQQLLYSAQIERVKAIEQDKECLNQQLEETLELKTQEEHKRVELEEKHFDAQNMLLEAEEKIISLQKLGEQLEKALEEERQAKEDEEIVRQATVDLLEEELQAKDKLQAMLQQQNSLIDLEKQKIVEFADALETERRRIKEIDDEKEKLAQQLKESQERMASSNQRVRRLDGKVNKIAETVFGCEQARAPSSHRGRGFLAEVMVRTKLEETTPQQDQALATLDE